MPSIRRPSSSVFNVPWNTPGAIGSQSPNTGKFTRVDVITNSETLGRFASTAQYYTRLEIEHPGSPGIGLFHGGYWAWSIFSDRVLLNSGNSLCFVNETTAKMLLIALYANACVMACSFAPVSWRLLGIVSSIG